MKRLVSAYYDDHYPFNTFNLFDDYSATYSHKDLTKEDTLLVWGGADIWPGFYGKNLSPKSYADRRPSPRDMVEWELMERAKELEIPIIGICRGAQMLCALAGGYLMQHVTGHGGSHEVVTNDGQTFRTNSLHHQMMVPRSPNGELVEHTLVAHIPPDQLLSKEYWDEDERVAHNQEPEYIYFNKIKGHAIQWHPEMVAASARSTNYIKETLAKTYEAVVQPA